MRRILRSLNVVAAAVTLASGLAVLAQDLLVPGYREYHRDWVPFVAAYCAFQAFLLEQLLRGGPWLPWLVAARAAVAYVFLLSLTNLWPEGRYFPPLELRHRLDWTPGRYVYQLLDINGLVNVGLYALIFLGRGAFNTWSVLAFTEHWWKPLRRSHPFAGRLVTAGLVAGLVFPVWGFLVVITGEAKAYSSEAEAVAREVLRGITCEAVQEKAGQRTSDLRKRGEKNYHVQIEYYDCALTRVVVRTEDGHVAYYAGSPGDRAARDCCAPGEPAQNG